MHINVWKRNLGLDNTKCYQSTFYFDRNILKENMWIIGWNQIMVQIFGYAVLNLNSIDNSIKNLLLKNIAWHRNHCVKSHCFLLIVGTFPNVQKCRCDRYETHCNLQKNTKKDDCSQIHPSLMPGEQWKHTTIQIH